MNTNFLNNTLNHQLPYKNYLHTILTTTQFFNMLAFNPNNTLKNESHFFKKNIFTKLFTYTYYNKKYNKKLKPSTKSNQLNNNRLINLYLKNNNVLSKNTL